MSKPIAKFFSGKVNAAVWSNEKDGEIYYTFTVQKRIKDEKAEGGYKNVDGFFLGEAKDLVAIAIKLIAFNPYQATIDKPETGDLPF